MVEAALDRLRAARKVMMRSRPSCVLAEWNWTATPSNLNGGQQSHRWGESSFQVTDSPSQDWIDRREEA